VEEEQGATAGGGEGSIGCPLTVRRAPSSRREEEGGSGGRCSRDRRGEDQMTGVRRKKRRGEDKVVCILHTEP
jgi:hypothetical protein